jgi:hypothetical protein
MSQQSEYREVRIHELEDSLIESKQKDREKKKKQQACEIQSKGLIHM